MTRRGLSTPSPNPSPRRASASAALSVAAPPMTGKTAKNLQCSGYRNRLILRGVVRPNADGQREIFSGTIGRLGGASRRGQRLLRCHMDVGVDHRLGLVDPAQRRPDQLRLRLVGWAASRIASVSTRVSSAGSSAAISRTAAAGSTRQGTNELVHSDDVALLENLPPSCSRPWWSTRRVEPPRRIEQRSFARSGPELHSIVRVMTREVLA